MKENILIISGASDGIGFVTAKFFIKKKFEVINISRSECSLKGVKNIKCDLSKKNSLTNVIDKLINILGQQKRNICLVHNAFFYKKDSIFSCTASSLEKSFQVSISSPSLLNQKLIPYMKKGSSIIYIGSTLSEKAVKNAYTYSILKHATVGLMKASTQDLDNSGIHSCCICPGFTDTEMLRQHIKNEKVLDSIVQLNTQKRLIQPEEIAEFIYFCSTAPIINGSVLHANLGQIES